MKSPWLASGRENRSAAVIKVVYRWRQSEHLQHFCRLVECLGVTAEWVSVSDLNALQSVLRSTSKTDASIAILFDVESLAHLGTAEELAHCMDVLPNLDATVLLMVTSGAAAASDFLRVVSQGAVNGVIAGGSCEGTSFGADTGSFTRQLAGHSFPRNPSRTLGLRLKSSVAADVLMTLDQFPTFLRLRDSKMFVWSTLEVFDPFRLLAEEKEFETASDQYIPALIFAKFAFGERCWHNPSPGAGIVIDDPLLKKRYGFIDFQQLLRSARRNDFHITLAFIPWNHWRTRPTSVELFRAYSDCFGVCAHGCDHTKNEFRSNNFQELLRKNFLAKTRMDWHARRTGIPSQPIMVCPQEQYSLEGIRAFASSRQFLGLVNTGCIPRNLPEPQICGADLLSPAQDSFFGFPVFKRHYRTDMAVFAMSLFLGKPALLVEHHEFFREGPAAVEDFAANLASLRPGSSWTSLYDTITETHLRREVSAGTSEIRFFTDVFKFEHKSTERVEYRFIRRVPGTTDVRRVTVNGRNIPFNLTNDTLAFEFQADTPGVQHIDVNVAPITPLDIDSTGFKYQVSVAVRRALSEFRDNVVARNQRALDVGKSLSRLLKQSGG